MHTHCHAVEVQIGALIWAITKAEKKNKDTSGGATERTRRDIPTQRCRWRGLGGTWYDTQCIVFEELIGAPCSTV
jgi:hypothetical protein